MSSSSSLSLLRVSDFCRRHRSPLSPSSLHEEDDDDDGDNDDDNNHEHQYHPNKQSLLSSSSSSLNNLKVNLVVWYCPCFNCKMRYQPHLDDLECSNKNNGNNKVNSSLSDDDKNNDNNNTNLAQQENQWTSKESHTFFPIRRPRRQRQQPQVQRPQQEQDVNDANDEDDEDDSSNVLEDEPCSIAHVTVDVLKALALRQGSIVCVSIITTTSSSLSRTQKQQKHQQRQQQSILVRLQLLPPQLVVSSPLKHNIKKDDDEEEVEKTNNIEEQQLNINLNLFLSPTSATNLGVAWEGCHDDKNSCCWIESLSFHTSSSNQGLLRQYHLPSLSSSSSKKMKKAHEVILRPLGRFPTTTFQMGDDDNGQDQHQKLWPNFLSSNRTTTMTRSNETVMQQQHQLLNLPQPKRYRYFLQPGILLSIPHHPTPKLKDNNLCSKDNTENCNDSSSILPSSSSPSNTIIEVDYFEIVSLTTMKATTHPTISATINHNDSNSDDWYITTQSTRFRLEEELQSHHSRNSYNNTNMVRRLPPHLSLQQYFEFYFHHYYYYTNSRSITNSDDGGKNKNSRKKDRRIQQQQQQFHHSWNNKKTCIPPHPNLQSVQQAILHAGGRTMTTATAIGGGGGGSTSTSTTAIAEHIIPLIGTQIQHDLVTCVETAAHQVGMNCLSIRCGLAALGHLYHSGDRPSTGTGSLRDAMVGLQATIDMILSPPPPPPPPPTDRVSSSTNTNTSHSQHQHQQRLVPCVLHLYDIDSEWTATGRSQDKEMQEEQEERFWTIWKRALTTTPTTESVGYQNNYRSNNHHRRGMEQDPNGIDNPSSLLSSSEEQRNTNGADYITITEPKDANTTTRQRPFMCRRFAPKLLIVVSERGKSTASLWLQRWVHPTIVLDPPDHIYAQYLWQKTVDRRDNELSRHSVSNERNGNNTSDDNDKEVIEMLVRRQCAQDIVWLGQQLHVRRRLEQQQQQQQLHPHLSSSPTTTLMSDRPIMDVVTDLCRELDMLTNGRRTTSTTSDNKISRVHWKDVGGLSSVRREIMDAIELPLHYPHLFPQGGGRSGILLYGPPGTGKTLIAKAVATECGLPFLSVKGPELLGSYVGESEANVRGIFTSAREAAVQAEPNNNASGSVKASILFFDELDSLAPRRGGVGDGGGVMERVVATLLTELDQSSSSSGDEGKVFVLGATNRPDLLDPSLLRPGRLDRLVYVGIASSMEERASVLAAQIGKLKLEQRKEDDVENAYELAYAVVSTLPPGKSKLLSGADLSTIASGAALQAVQRLCRQADDEVLVKRAEMETLNNDSTQISIDEVLLEWDEDRLVPTVTLEDLLNASKEVTPSVTLQELERYEQLRDQFASR